MYFNPIFSCVIGSDCVCAPMVAVLEIMNVAVGPVTLFFVHFLLFRVLHCLFVCLFFRVTPLQGLADPLPRAEGCRCVVA